LSGETVLRTLLREMSPVLSEGELVFCSVPADYEPPPGLDPMGQFVEEEGLTLIVSRERAETAGLDTAYPCRRITLRVHSSLSAVGFLAEITRRLAERGISVNAISGYYHDHLFIPSGRAEEAVAALLEIVASARATSD